MSIAWQHTKAFQTSSLTYNSALTCAACTHHYRSLQRHCFCAVCLTTGTAVAGNTSDDTPSSTSRSYLPSFLWRGSSATTTSSSNNTNNTSSATSADVPASSSSTGSKDSSSSSSSSSASSSSNVNGYTKQINGYRESSAEASAKVPAASAKLPLQTEPAPAAEAQETFVSYEHST
jgi:hypothetical protein